MLSGGTLAAPFIEGFGRGVSNFQATLIPSVDGVVGKPRRPFCLPYPATLNGMIMMSDLALYLTVRGGTFVSVIVKK